MTKTENGRWEISSPDGGVTASVLLTEGKLFLTVADEEGEVFGASPLGIYTSVADFSQSLSYLSGARQSIREAYRMVCGKKALYHNEAEELTLRFACKAHWFAVVIRAFHDGVAYRYQIPGEGPVSILGEESAFALPGGAAGWAQEHVVHYEGRYLRRTSAELLGGVWGMPLLLAVGKRFALLSEAAVYGTYCGSHLEGDAQANLLRVKFACDQGPSVVGAMPFETPWRVAVIGTLADIVETEMFENLNPPCEPADTSWIHPGRAAWSWWSGDSTDELAVQKAYVDFAAEMGWEYYLCDAGWQESWIGELVGYAAKKHVGIFVWYHYKSLQTDDELVTVLPYLKSVGVRGVKVDFFESDSQERIRLYDKIALLAEKLRLMVIYHGCTKPAGERRRWPHVMTREGILGAEYYKIDAGPDARHNCTVPFTRNVTGPMDYTPVTFSNPKLNTTWAHQLALAVVFESCVQHLADRPQAYEKLGDALAFLKACPTSWDDTRLVEGYPGEYVTIARRNGRSWFVGALCSEAGPRTAEIALSFLGEGLYEADIWSDGETQQTVKHQKTVVGAQDTLEIALGACGGCCVRLMPADGK